MVDITEVNVVASASVGVELDLQEISSQLDELEYEPEQFPGLVYRVESPKVVALLFSSGKVVCTGAKKISDIELAVNSIIEELKSAGFL